MKIQIIQQYNQYFKGKQAARYRNLVPNEIVVKSTLEQLTDSKIKEVAERVAKKYKNPYFREGKKQSIAQLNQALENFNEKLRVSKEQLFKPFDI